MVGWSVGWLVGLVCVLCCGKYRKSIRCYYYIAIISKIPFLQREKRCISETSLPKYTKHGLLILIEFEENKIHLTANKTIKVLVFSQLYIYMVGRANSYFRDDRRYSPSFDSTTVSCHYACSSEYNNNTQRHYSS